VCNNSHRKPPNKVGQRTSCRLRITVQDRTSDVRQQTPNNKKPPNSQEATKPKDRRKQTPRALPANPHKSNESAQQHAASNSTAKPRNSRVSIAKSSASIIHSTAGAEPAKAAPTATKVIPSQHHQNKRNNLTRTPPRSPSNQSKYLSA
jgi:hypothetical protein